MPRILLLLLIVLLLPAPGTAADINLSEGMDFPDLLTDSPEDGLYGPDLLGGDPYILDPVELMGDPLFEDDFTLNKPGLVISDPLEPMNRVFFEFNDKLYFWVLKPVNTAYSSVVPSDLRVCLGNFFNNLAAPIRFLNNFLQGEIEDAGVVLGRFLINSTIGVFGLGDAAYRVFDLEPRTADFGQTLGKWGIGEGIYLCWPGLGPLNVRDTFGFIGDVYMHPVPYVTDSTTIDLTYLVVNRVNTLSVSPPVYEELKRISLDPYIAARQAFYEYRRAAIQTR